MLLAVVEYRDSLAYFVANTFALAACWVVSAVIGAAVAAQLAGQFMESFTRSASTARKTEKLIAVLGSALLGLNGGLIIARIDEFAGLLSMVYLWAFVFMATAVFFGRPGPRPSPLGINDDLEAALLQREMEASEAGLVTSAFSKSGAEGFSVPGAAFGALIGVVYGVLTSWLIPLSTNDNILMETSTADRLSWAAAGIWVVLCGFSGSVGANRAGLGRGISAMLFGLILGTGVGGLLAIIGLVLGNQTSAALNGAAGAAFFGAIIAAEMRQFRY